MIYVIVVCTTGEELQDARQSWKPYALGLMNGYKAGPNLYELWVPIR